MIDKVEALMREVAAEVILPRFRRLTPEEIHEKAPGDVVTAADQLAESMLTNGLSALLPGSRVVGEEAVASDPSVLSVLATPGDVWVVDPIDGTSNFVAGREPFAVMVALLRDGVAVAAWILDPVSGVAAVAERGSGAFLGGERVRVPSGRRSAHELRGPAISGYMPAEVRAAVAAARDTVGEVAPGRNCAGYEYLAIIRDEQQFVVFWRGLPWDHAPGVLLVQEAGGAAWHLDGSPFTVTESHPGLLVAQSQEDWTAVRGTLLAAIA